MFFNFRNARDIFGSPTFLTLSYPGLLRILLEDGLDLEEVSVFKNVLRYDSQY